MDNDQIFERIKDSLRSKVETFMEEVTPVYQQLNWVWNINGELRVPNEEDVMFKLYNLVDALKFDKRGYWTAYNGLKVQYKFKKNGSVEVEMIFSKEIIKKELCTFK